MAARKELVRRTLPPDPGIKEKACSTFIMYGTGNWCVYGVKIAAAANRRW